MDERFPGDVEPVFLKLPDELPDPFPRERGTVIAVPERLGVDVVAAVDRRFEDVSLPDELIEVREVWTEAPSR